MTKSLEIAGKKMHSIRYASACIGYSHDYVTRLAREGKIAAAQVGRNWYVDLDSLTHYASVMELELKLRQQQLSDERKRERQLNQLVQYQSVQVLQKNSVRGPSLKIAALASVALVICSALALKQLPGIGKAQLASVEQVHQVQGLPVVGVSSNKTFTEDPQHLNFSHESFNLSTLSDKTQGVLLLPSNGTSSPNTAAMFSDEVKVVTDSKTGEQFVALMNDKGEVVEKIPFVVVPVNTKKTP